ncbi:MAG: flagellar hook-basal body complex protein [Clostridiaceae bacterium]|nr:flagellar hook-basal body complex protein [Clostridiaceae bacterium]
MIRGLYTAISGLITQEAKMDVITNNMSNVNTAGFKGDDLKIKKFDDVLLQSYDRLKGKGAGKTTIGSISLGSRIDETTTSFEQGEIQTTGKQTDFALDGRGFFTVQKDNGTSTQKYYTRDGNFHVDSKGTLVTNNGDAVLDSNGNSINVGSNKFSSDAEGNITIANNETSVKLAVVDFNTNISTNNAYKNLLKVGDNLYTSNEVAQTSNAAVRQNSSEKSNVNVITQMIDMMNTMRTFETNQKVIQAIDQTLGRAVNEVGTVR